MSIFVDLKKHESGFRSALMKNFHLLEKVYSKIHYAMEFI